MEKLIETTCHIQRNLNALKNLPRVASYNIKDLPGAKKAKRRRGRGPGNGKGKTAGRGHKGQGQRGTKTYFQFEGGQTPFYRLVPKHGQRKSIIKNMQLTPVNLDRLQYFVDSGRIDPKETITMRVMRMSGLVSGKISGGVKLLGMGADWFDAKLNIEVSLASKSAIEAIERQGGTVNCVYFDKVGLRVHLRPESFSPPIPKQARPPAKLMELYADAERRGFLADKDEIQKLRDEKLKAGELAKTLEELEIK